MAVSVPIAVVVVGVGNRWQAMLDMACAAIAQMRRDFNRQN
jgi:hypothetical protein